MPIKRKIERPVHHVFNDGYLFYGHREVKRNDTGKRVGEAFEKEGKLAFELMSARDQDYALAGYQNANLDLKVRTMYPPKFEKTSLSKLKCLIDEIEYDVIKVDWDNDRHYLFFYLQEVGVSDE